MHRAASYSTDRRSLTCNAMTMYLLISLVLVGVAKLVSSAADVTDLSIVDL